MPTSAQGSSSRPTRRLRSDEQGVSEVIGQILVFGILSIVLVLSMVAFNAAKSSATEHAAELQAQAIAQQVAAVVVAASLHAENHNGQANFTRMLHFPEQLEARDYTVRIGRTNETDPNAKVDRVRVDIPDLGRNGTAVLFNAGAAVKILEGPRVPGGPLSVRFDRHAICTDPPNPTDPQPCVFLEALP